MKSHRIKTTLNNINVHDFNHPFPSLHQKFNHISHPSLLICFVLTHNTCQNTQLTFKQTRTDKKYIKMCYRYLPRAIKKLLFI
jgi:hypothetical protein